MGEAVNVGVRDGSDVAVTSFVAVASFVNETVSVRGGRTEAVLVACGAASTEALLQALNNKVAPNSRMSSFFINY